MKLESERYDEVRKEIRQIGTDIGGIAGRNLASSVPGGDYRDLRMFLRRGGVGPDTMERVNALLTERDQLAATIQAEPKSVDPKLGNEWWRK